MAPRNAPDVEGFLRRASGIVGDVHLLTDLSDRTLYSTDFSERMLAVAEAVVRPGSTQEVAALARAATEAGVALVARGGGMSYTLGYAPARAGTVTLDMRRMNRIVHLDTQDMTVTVETGVTWAQLHEALLPTGYRVGFMGPQAA